MQTVTSKKLFHPDEIEQILEDCGFEYQSGLSLIYSFKKEDYTIKYCPYNKTFELLNKKESIFKTEEVNKQEVLNLLEEICKQ